MQWLQYLPLTSEQLWFSGSVVLLSAPSLIGNRGNGRLLSAVSQSAPKASHPLESLGGNQSLCNLLTGWITKHKLSTQCHPILFSSITFLVYTSWSVFLKGETKTTEMGLSSPASLFFIVIRQRAWFVMSRRGVSPWSLVERASTLKVCHESCGWQNCKNKIRENIGFIKVYHHYRLIHKNT